MVSWGCHLEGTTELLVWLRNAWQGKLVSGGAGLELVANCSNWDSYLQCLTQCHGRPDTKSLSQRAHTAKRWNGQQPSFSLCSSLLLSSSKKAWVSSAGTLARQLQWVSLFLKPPRVQFFSIWYPFLAPTSSKFPECISFENSINSITGLCFSDQREICASELNLERSLWNPVHT